MALPFLIQFRSDGAEKTADDAKKIAKEMNGITDAMAKAGTRAQDWFRQRFGGAAILGHFEALARQAWSYADSIQDIADRLGISAEKAQEWDYAAKQSGISLEVVAASYRRLRAVLAEIQSGGKGPLADLIALGISEAEAKTITAEKAFERIAKAMEQGTMGAKELSAVFAVMGRQADALVPAMQNGFLGLANDIRAAGGIIKQDVVDQIGKANDQLDRMKTIATANLAPALAKVVDLIGRIVAGWQLITDVAPTYWGARAGGATPEKAARMAQQKGMEIAAPWDTSSLPPKKTPPPDTESLAPAATPIPTKALPGLSASKATGDALARIGLFRGGSTFEKQLDVMTRQLAQLRILVEEVRGIKQYIPDNDGMPATSSW